MPAKTLAIFLGTPPYGYENADTALRLAETALAKGPPRSAVRVG